MRSSIRLLRVVLLVSSLAILGGCGLFSQKDARFDPAPLTDYSPTLATAVRWSASIGSGGGYGFSPQQVGDTVFVAVSSGKITALDAQRGAVRWQVSGPALTAGAGSDGSVVAVAAQDGTILAYDAANGKALWHSQAASAVNVPPAVGNGIVAVRTTDYRIQAFDARSGKLRWEVQRPGPALALRTSMRLKVLPDVLVAGMPNGRILLLNAATGAVRWEGTVSTSRGASDLERISDVVGQPAVVGSLLCGVSYQGRTACFDIGQGGRAVWAKDISSATGLAAGAHTLYVTGPGDVVFALDLQDGHERWHQRALLNRRLTEPAVAGTAVVVGDYQGYLHFLSREDGHLMARLRVGSEPLTALVATQDGVLVQNGDGKLLRVAVSG